MPNLAVQRLIYRYLVQKGPIVNLNPALDCIGKGLNAIGRQIGCSKDIYATGLTRNIAILFASSNAAEIQTAQEGLYAADRNRAIRAVEIYQCLKLGLSGNAITPALGMGALADLDGGFDTEKFIQETLKSFPQANRECVEAAVKAKLSPDQILLLLGKIVEKCGVGAKFAFEALPAALDKAKETFSPDQILLLFDRIIDKCNNSYEGSAYSVFYDLPTALEASIKASLKANLSPQQIADLFGKIVEKAGKYVADAFNAPAVLEASIKANLSSQQIADFFGKIVEENREYRENVFSTLPTALEASIKANLSPQQIADLFEKIMEKTKKWAGDAFSALPAALDANMSSQQILDLFGMMMEKTSGGLRARVFMAIPTALNGALKDNLPPQQISDLFGKIVKRYRLHAEYAFSALPVALEAKLSHDQILNLFDRIIDKCGSNAHLAFYGLPAALDIKLSHDQILDLFGRIIDKCGGKAGFAFNAFQSLFGNFIFLNADQSKFAVTRFLAMLESLTNYNRGRVLELLKEKGNVYQQIGRNNFLPHFNLYMDILTNRKRLGFALLEGVLEATRLGIIPAELTREETAKINRFIDQTHSFSPIVYKVYRERGEALIEELRPIGRKIVEDKLRKEEIDAIIEKYNRYDGLEFLYAIIQISIPLSGASFVKREEGKSLLQKMMAAGDLRGHVPVVLRGKTRSISLAEMTYVLKENEAIDLQAIIPILEALRSEKKAELPELIGAVEAYLRSNRSEPDKEILRQTLYRYASKRDLLGEKVDRLGATDYYTLRLLEEIFRDKDCLASILVRALKDVEPALLAADKTPITHPEALVKTLRKMWQGDGTKDQKTKLLAAMVARYQESELSEKVLNKMNKESDRELAAALAELLGQANQAYLSKHKLAEELLQEPLLAIQKEKAKYELAATADSLNLSLRMVKGIPFSLWGLNAGVCVAPDVELWQDPNFKLIAMIDEATGSAVGFIQLYEQTTNGQKVWTLPGLNPSTEFIGTVDPTELYDKMMEQVVDLAKTAGAAAVYIPTAPVIHSNRSDIQKVIKDKNYPTRMIPQVNWSRQPAYPFEEVFVVWERIHQE